MRRYTAFQVPTEVEVPIKTSPNGKLRWVALTLGVPERSMGHLRQLAEFTWTGDRSSGYPVFEGLADDPDYMQVLEELGTVPLLRCTVRRRGGQLRAENETHAAGAWSSFSYDLERAVQRVRACREHPALARRMTEPYYRDQWEWALIHGSERLKQGLLSGHKMNGLYRRERGEVTFPNCYVDADDAVQFRERPNPSERALELREELIQRADDYDGSTVDPIVSWVTSVPDDVLGTWRLAGADVDLSGGGLEAVRIDAWLGRHRVWAFVDHAPLSARCPYTGDSARGIARAQTDNPMRSVQFASAYGVTEPDAQRALQAGAVQVTDALTRLGWLSQDEPHPGILAIFAALPPGEQDRYDEQFFSRFSACASVVAFKLAQAEAQPFTSVAEHLALDAICLAAEEFTRQATGHPEDLHWYFTGLSTLDFPDEGPDLQADPNLAFDHWFEPYDPQVGQAHPLLTWNSEPLDPWSPTFTELRTEVAVRAGSALLDRARALFREVREHPVDIQSSGFVTPGLLIEPDDVGADDINQLAQVLLRCSRDYGEHCYVHGMVRTGERSGVIARDEEPDCLLLDVRHGHIS